MATYNVLLDKDRFVWFETNSQSGLDNWKLVATEWQQVGYLVATARQSNVIDFVGQMLAVPGVNGVVSGFKTSDFWDFTVDSPYDTAIWQQVRDLADSVATASGGNPVILENEGNLNNARSEGITSIDPVALQTAIEGVVGAWPQIWHWYAPTAETEPARQMAWDWAKGFIGAVPSAHFIEPNSSGYTGSPIGVIAKENLQRTLELDPSPYSIVYLDDVLSSQWDLADAWQTIQYVRGQATILYPGFGDLNNYAAVQASYAAAPRPTYRVQVPAGGDTYNVMMPP